MQYKEGEKEPFPIFKKGKTLPEDTDDQQEEIEGMKDSEDFKIQYLKAKQDLMDEGNLKIHPPHTYPQQSSNALGLTYCPCSGNSFQMKEIG